LRSGEGLITSSTKDNSVKFSGEKRYNEAFRGVFFFDNTRKNFKSNLVFVVTVVLVLESKGLFYFSYLNVATKFVVGQPTTNDLSDGLVVSQTSSRQLANQISLTLTRCLSLNDDVDLKRQQHSTWRRLNSLESERVSWRDLRPLFLRTTVIGRRLSTEKKKRIPDNTLMVINEGDVGSW